LCQHSPNQEVSMSTSLLYHAFGIRGTPRIVALCASVSLKRDVWVCLKQAAVEPAQPDTLASSRGRA
jgi:hypothetical protein